MLISSIYYLGSGMKLKKLRKTNYSEKYTFDSNIYSITFIVLTLNKHLETGSARLVKHLVWDMEANMHGDNEMMMTNYHI